MMWSTIWKVARATTLFAIVHSLLASRAIKGLAVRLLGRRRRNSFYRPFYLAQSLLTFGALVWYVRRLPNKTLYEIQGRPARLMQFGQLLGILYAFEAGRQVGLTAITGWRNVRAWLDDDLLVPPEPEAQGPALDQDNRMKATGPFRLSRHPLNFAPLPIFWLSPRMSLQLLIFNLVATPYLVLGSLHEERRLRAAYGGTYMAYQKSRVPFYVPFTGRILKPSTRRPLPSPDPAPVGQA